MLKRLVRAFAGDPVKRALQAYLPVVEAVNALEKEYERLSDEALRAKTIEFRRRLAQGETLDDLLPEAFAAVREASKRTIGLRHYDVQIIGGAVLHQGKVAEMKTGEGKTLVATLPLYLNALALNPRWVERARARWGDDPARWAFEPIEGEPVGRGVHLVTVNDYLARRDARWMAPIYDLLGLSVGVLQMAARTENGKKAFLVDLEKRSSQEDQDQLRMVPRQEAYRADILYGTNSEFGFDYLRDNMAMRWEDRVQRGHYYAIIDEVDNVLIDEARTPLIISGPAGEATEWYVRMAQIVKGLKPGDDVEINERDRTVTLTPLGEAKVEEALGFPLRDPERPEDLTPEQERIWGYLEQALRAQFLFHRNRDYVVQGGRVIIVDEFTGRLMPGRRWSDGLHQAVEAKEGVRVQAESITYATITIQNYFRMYEKLAGMTGTAATEAEEFDKIYKLEVVVIPTNLEYQATRPGAPLVTLEAEDEEGYRFTYYARRDDPERRPVFWKRKDYPDVIYRTEEAKFRAVAWEVLRFYIQGRPVLVGTTSVERSEHLSRRLKAEALRKLAQVMLLRDAFLRRHDGQEGRYYPELAPLYEPLEQLNTGELRRLSREWGVPFNPEHPENLERLRDLLLPTPSEQARWEEALPRLLDALRGGVPHAVLNARKHDEESQIIAGAGAFGAVTIATNMAGRGVDIKLGGELAEEILSAVNRVLRRAGHDPFNMTLDERYRLLRLMDPAQYGIYEAEVQHFLRYIEDMHRVRQLGGLHVIGSERHESRRIDNQLRGRAARQGDPGSSRFFLSLEDDLVRLFGGQSLEGLMARLQVDPMTPLEHGLVSRVIEQAQARVEGANFDMRKHLLEYDDVLNAQRARIYAQRDRVFLKDDLTEDIDALLEEEIRTRAQALREQPEEAWRLVAYLEQIQPTLELAGRLYPSLPMRWLLDRLPLDAADPAALEAEARRLITAAWEAEADHYRQQVHQYLDHLLEGLERQVEEKTELLDTFLSTWEDEAADEEDEPGPRRPADPVERLAALLGVPLRRIPLAELLTEDPDAAREEVLAQVERVLLGLTVARAIIGVNRLLGADLGLNPNALLGDPADEDAPTWDDRLMAALEAWLQQRGERLFGSEGVVWQELHTGLQRLARDPEQWADPEQRRQAVLRLLLSLQQGRQQTFDPRTHRRVWVRTQRFRYLFLAARWLAESDPDTWAEQALDHLHQVLENLAEGYGRLEVQRLAQQTPAQLEPRARRWLRQVLGEDAFAALADTPLGAWPAEQQPDLAYALGRHVLTEAHRRLLLQVITNAWVEYLTRMEALRVSIGLEAYAQRDPLVQYKARAFEEYERLIREIRAGVVTRLFTYRPQEAQVQAESPTRAAAAPQGDADADEEAGPKKKRRRRRRKK